MYYDGFDDPSSGWHTDESDSGHRRFVNSEYEMLISNSYWWKGSTAPYTVELPSFAVAAHLRRLSGDTEYYGLVFNRKDWDNYHSTWVSPDTHPDTLHPGQRVGLIVRSAGHPPIVMRFNNYRIERLTSAQ